MNLKDKKTRLATLINEAKTKRAEMEARHAKGEQVPGEDVTAWEELIAVGQVLRGEIEREEGMNALEAFVSGTHEQRSVDRAGGPPQRKSWGQLVTASPEFKAAAARGKMERVEVKALYAGTDATGGALVWSDRQTEVVELARQRPRSILDLINTSPTQSDLVEYITMTGRTNAAAVVPEFAGGVFGLKPESDMAFGLVQAAVKTIATWIAASKQILADAPRLRNVIDTELTYMLGVTLENQVLTGDGTGNNFTGILNWSGIQTRAHQAGSRGLVNDTIADTIRRGITDLRLAFYEPDAVVLNPADGEAMELLKDGNDRYVNIYDPVGMRVWRVPLVETAAMTAGIGLVGNFRLGATLWDRMQTEILTGTVNDQMIRNAITILAELRAAFGVVRPQAFEKLTGLAA